MVIICVDAGGARLGDGGRRVGDHLEVAVGVDEAHRGCPAPGRTVRSRRRLSRRSRAAGTATGRRRPWPA